METYLFPFSQYWWAYITFTGLIAFLLALDLGVFNKTPHAVSIKEATIWTVVWTVVALIFNWSIWGYAAAKFPPDVARQVALEFAAGYVIERALSFDNIFIFIVVFNYFAIPPRLQHRVLFYGIIGAFVFRGIFIALGSVLMQFHWVVVIFGVLLIVTGIRMVSGGDDQIEPEKNPFIRLLKRWVPITTEIHGARFFVKKNRKWHATPLLVALLFLELTDIVFAIDSVPAVFALTKEPLLVFTSNIFAILGLRAMYFMLAGAMELFYLLKYGLAAVLVFVGLKMTIFNDVWLPHISIGWSLTVICLILAVSVVFSLVIPRKKEV